MKKVLLVFGTRPEAIKMVSVARALKSDTRFEAKVCVTGQHREMLDQVLKLFSTPADFDLDLMMPKQDLTDVTCNVLKSLRDVLKAWRPDIMLVQGDTTTTLAASLSAYYERIAVGHVEAGLRTGNIYSPWPEEVNRRIASAIAAYHFAPTNEAKLNLLREGVDKESIHVTGNTVVDALLEITARLRDDSGLRSSLETRFPFASSGRRLLLVTGHRRESFGQGFLNICLALKQIASREDVEIVYPVHLNPNVQQPVRQLLSGCPRVHLLDPLEYLAFVYLMDRAYFIITDSGGVQEEAPSLGKPVLVMRDTTERPEAVSAGTVLLVGTEPEAIVAAAFNLLDNRTVYETMARAHNPYGDGRAAHRIARILGGDRSEFAV